MNILKGYKKDDEECKIQLPTFVVCQNDVISINYSTAAILFLQLAATRSSDLRRVLSCRKLGRSTTM